MAMISGKQLRDASISAAKLAASVLAPFVKADGTVSWSAAMNAGSQRLTNLGAPSSPTDAARLQDIMAQPWKEKCVAATTGNITLSGLNAVDGYTPSANDRILVRAQTSAAENGVYLAASGSWTRAADCDSAEELRAMQVRIERGTTFADHSFALTTDDVTLGTTALNFVDLGAGAQVAYATASNKEMTASVTSADGDEACPVAIAATPVGDGYVRVFINGIGIAVGNGTKVGVPCYFSADGTAARALTDITGGDKLYFNGSVAGFELDADDVIDFDYSV